MDFTRLSGMWLGVLTFAVLSSGCAHVSAPSAADAADTRDSEFVIGVAAFHEGAGLEGGAGRAEGELYARMFATTGGVPPLRVVPLFDTAPADGAAALTLGRAHGVDLVLWGTVAHGEDGALVVDRHTTTASGPHPGKETVQFPPGRYVLPGDQSKNELEALQFDQALLDLSALFFMMRDEPASARAALTALVPRRPHDFVAQNEDIIERRWGMLFRLNRDGRGAELRYRHALEELAKQGGNDAHKRAFYTVGLARGLILQGRIDEAIPLLTESLRLAPSEGETRQLLGRALLARRQDAQAAEVLRPWAAQGWDVVSIRMLAEALPDSPEVAGDFAKVARQLDYPYVQILRAIALPHDVEARAAVAALATGPKVATWPASLAKFALGELDETTLLSVAHTGDRESTHEQLSQAYEIIGETKVARDPNAARAAFTAAIATHAMHQDAYNVADFWLDRLASTNEAKGQTTAGTR